MHTSRMPVDACGMGLASLPFKIDLNTECEPQRGQWLIHTLRPGLGMLGRNSQLFSCMLHYYMEQAWQKAHKLVLEMGPYVLQQVIF